MAEVPFNASTLAAASMAFGTTCNALTIRLTLCMIASELTRGSAIA